LTTLLHASLDPEMIDVRRLGAQLCVEEAGVAMSDALVDDQNTAVTRLCSNTNRLRSPST
jgi:hypothetical protein